MAVRVLGCPGWLPYTHYIGRLAKRVTFTFHAVPLILSNRLLKLGTYLAEGG